jgi:hypothetical protein
MEINESDEDNRMCYTLIIILFQSGGQQNEIRFYLNRFHSRWL